jgi:hypothetical protein
MGEVTALRLVVVDANTALTVKLCAGVDVEVVYV